MQINPNHTQSDSTDSENLRTEEEILNTGEGDVEASRDAQTPEDIRPEQDAMTDIAAADSDDDVPERVTGDEATTGDSLAADVQAHEPGAISEVADSDDGAVDPADEGELRGILEALIFASDEPLTFKQIKDLLAPEQQEEGDEETAPGNGRRRQTRLTITRVKRGIDYLNAEYEESGRAFRIIEVSGGFAFQTTGDFGAWVGRLFAERSRRRLTQSALETLSIIAFKQPISKPAIEGIRGVNAEYVVKSLLERNLISIVGREDSPGRPLLYGTTKHFLKHFGLSSINDLPKPREIEDLLSSEDELGVNPIDEMDPGQAMSLTNMSSQELERLFDTARLRTKTSDGDEADGLTDEEESTESGGLRVMLDVGEAASDELAAHAAASDGVPADALEIEQDLSEWSEVITDGVDEEMVEEYFGKPHDMPDDDTPEGAQPSDTDDDEEDDDDEDDDETEDRGDDEDDLYDDEDEEESGVDDDDDDDDGFLETDATELADADDDHADEIADTDELGSADIGTDVAVDFGDFDPDFLSDDDLNDSEDETDTDTEETGDGNYPFDTDIPEEDEDKAQS